MSRYREGELARYSNAPAPETSLTFASLSHSMRLEEARKHHDQMERWLADQERKFGERHDRLRAREDETAELQRRLERVSNIMYWCVLRCSSLLMSQEMREEKHKVELEIDAVRAKEAELQASR